MRENSPAALEAASFIDMAAVEVAYDQGRLLIYAALDHLIGLSKTLTEPITVNAPWACARAVLETSAHSAWILETSLSASDRVARALASEFVSASEYKKFLHSIQKPGDTSVETQTHRIAGIVGEAERFGLPPILDKKGKTVGAGTRMLGATELIKYAFNDAPTYRLMSAMTHGQQWALIAFGYEKVNDVDPKSRSFGVRTRITPLTVSYLATHSVRALVRPVSYLSRQYGFDRERLKSILESSYDVIEFADQERFWRSPNA